MSELVAFLSARLDEDEAVARKVLPSGRPLEVGAAHWFETGRSIGDRSGYVVAYSIEHADCRAHIARFDPARVLAEVDAKRRIVALHTPVGWERAYCSTCDESDPHPCATLRLLALPYADHPDYRQEWTP